MTRIYLHIHKREQQQHREETRPFREQGKNARAKRTLAHRIVLAMSHQITTYHWGSVRYNYSMKRTLVALIEAVESQ